jgi:hypothetical protein
MSRHVEESSRRLVVASSQKPVRMEFSHRISVKSTSLGIAHLLIKHSGSVWFHQRAVAVMALITVVYLFFFYVMKVLILI